MLTEKLRREIGAVFPRKSMMGDCEVLESLDISKRTEDRSLQLSTEVDLATGTIIEAQPYCVVMDVPGFQDMQKHRRLQRIYRL